MKVRRSEETSTKGKKGWIRVVAEWYDRTTFAHVLRSVEPIGLVIAAAGIVFAAYQLELSREEIALNRKVAKATLEEFEASRREREETRKELAAGRVSREANLLALTLERVQAARAMDRRPDRKGKVPKRRATYTNDKGREKCLGSRLFSGGAISRAGQIPLLEAMVKLGYELREIDLSGVTLVVPRSTDCAAPGITLSGADLSGAKMRNSNLRCAALDGAVMTDAWLDEACLKGVDFTGAMLRNADLSDSDLRGAILINACLAGAELGGSNLARADFSGADFTGMDVTDVDFRGALNVTKRQMDQACGGAPAWRPAGGVSPKNGLCPEKAKIRCQTEK